MVALFYISDAPTANNSQANYKLYGLLQEYAASNAAAGQVPWLLALRVIQQFTSMHAKVDRKVKSVTTEFIPRHSTYILFGNCDARAIAMMITTI